MVRTAKRSEKRNAKRDEGGLPQFSAAFIAEVGDCPDISAFQELLEHKGLWLNRNAAEGVFGYLRSMTTSQELRDEDLATVMGGTSWNGHPDAQLTATLQILSDQLNGVL